MAFLRLSVNPIETLLIRSFDTIYGIYKMALILSVNNKQLLDKVFVTSGITEVEVSVAKCYQPSRFFSQSEQKRSLKTTV